ncbi:unnamed protein product [Protopolystoma xenopodis]|uniref:Uncharacterized protein n=1 Tax=Protopolystoma xenopodis TaxID=117903 RepID=A0A3S5A2J4_9PLAT|nr:unnamed protein product [Protopolystoma xenopodis]
MSLIIIFYLYYLQLHSQVNCFGAHRDGALNSLGCPEARPLDTFIDSITGIPFGGLAKPGLLLSELLADTDSTNLPISPGIRNFGSLGSNSDLVSDSKCTASTAAAGSTNDGLCDGIRHKAKVADAPPFQAGPHLVCINPFHYSYGCYSHLGRISNFICILNNFLLFK